MKSSRVLFVIMMLASAGVSCAGPEALDLLDPEQTDWEERRRRLDITVQYETEGGFRDPVAISPTDFRALVTQHCGGVVRATYSLRECSDAGMNAGTFSMPPGRRERCRSLV